MGTDHHDYEQLPLDLDYQEELSEENFFINTCNEKAFQFAKQWQSWTHNALIIWGPSSCGKSHLAHVWRRWTKGLFLSYAQLNQEVPSPQVIEESSALIIDDGHLVTSYTHFLHVFNLCQYIHHPLLVTMNTPPARLPITLADLSSRLNSTMTLDITAPQEDVLKLLLIKQCSEQHLPLSEEWVHYIICRLERSYDAVKRYVSTLRRLCLLKRKNPTLPLIKEALNQLMLHEAF